MYVDFTSSDQAAQQKNSSLPAIPRSTLLDGICSDFEHEVTDAITTLWRFKTEGFIAPRELDNIIFGKPFVTAHELASRVVAGFRSLEEVR